MEILNKIKLSSVVIVMATALSSCYSDFDPDIASQPRLCMNSVINAGEPITVELSHTYRYNSGFANEQDLRVPDASVVLYVDGKETETGVFVEEQPDESSDDNDDTEASKPLRSLYKFNYCPRPGEQLELRATSASYGDANATVTVPLPPAGLSLENRFNATYADIKPDDSISPSFIRTDGQIGITLTDRESTDDFYRLEVEIIDPEPIFTGETIETLTGPFDVRYMSTLESWGIDTEKETLFQEHLGVLDVMFSASTYGETIFSDRMISGKSYTLDIGFRNAYILVFNPKKIESLYHIKVRVKLSVITESFYNWWLLDWQENEGFQGQLSGIGLAENMVGYSNVSTKAGIVAATASAVAEIDLADFIKKVLAGDSFN